MGGRGSSAKKDIIKYRTIRKIKDVTVIERIDKTLKGNLPIEGYSSKGYILLDENNKFKQYREYNKDHSSKFDIDYHPKPKETGSVTEKVYHIHYFKNGIRQSWKKIKTKKLNKYRKKYLGGF